MKLKRYKNKKTGQAFKKEYGDYYYVNAYVPTLARIPAEYVEDSDDWEEIRENLILLTTEDQFNVTDPQQELYYFNKVTWENKGKAKAANIRPGYTNLLYFSSTEARDRYILLNKPIFSLHEVMGYVIQEYHEVSPSFERIENFPNLANMAKKKINEAT